MNENSVSPYPELEEEEGYMNIEQAMTPVEKFREIPKNSLDQDMCDSFCNEIKGICMRFSYVLFPRKAAKNSPYLRSWDLWGPFLMCLFFIFFIDNSNTFLVIVISIIVGAIIVTYNIKVLGGSVSFLQSVAILGYCTCPLFIALTIVQILKLFNIQNNIIRIVLIVVSIIWCILASRSFVAVNIPKDRKCVAVYPLVLFYTFLGVMMIFG